MSVAWHYKLWGKESNVEGLGDHLWMKPWAVDVCQCCACVYVYVCACGINKNSPTFHALCYCKTCIIIS